MGIPPPCGACDSQAAWRWQHAVDWLALGLLLLATLAVEYRAPSATAYVPAANLPRYSYPLNPRTVPTEVAPVIAIVLPLSVMAAVRLARRRPGIELHRLTLALLASVLLAGVSGLCKICVRKNLLFKMFLCRCDAMMWL